MKTSDEFYFYIRWISCKQIGFNFISGSNAGIIVNKQQIGDQEDALANVNAQLCLEFRVFLVNVATKRYTQEKRVISFWFKELFPVHQRTTAAQEFFKKLVSPVDFPRGIFLLNLSRAKVSVLTWKVEIIYSWCI